MHACMYVYVYDVINTYIIHTCMHTCIHTYIHSFICIYIYIYTYTYIYIYVYIYTFVYMYTCVNIIMYACICLEPHSKADVYTGPVALRSGAEANDGVASALAKPSRMGWNPGLRLSPWVQSTKI